MTTLKRYNPLLPPQYIINNIENFLLDAGYQGTITSYSDMMTKEDLLEDSDNFKNWIISVDEPFTVRNDTFNDGDVVYWYFGGWCNLSNLIEDNSWKFDQKWLSVITSRFFDGDITTNYPNFVQFCKEWLVQCDEGFWSIASKMSSFGDVDNVPEELLPLFLTHYAAPFARDARSIPYFYNSTTSEWNYDNVRHFLRLARKFALTKGTPQSIFFIFKMFEGKLILQFPYKQLMILDDYRPVFTVEDEIFTPTGDYEEGAYISCRDGDSEDTLYHLHGEDDVEGIKWAYYTLVLKTDLDLETYPEIIERIVKPAGIQYFWKQLLIPTDNTGEQYSDPIYVHITNTTEQILTISDIEIPDDYEALLMGRDSEYSSEVAGFDLPVGATYILAIRYTGNESDWITSSFVIVANGVDYLTVNLG